MPADLTRIWSLTPDTKRKIRWIATKIRYALRSLVWYRTLFVLFGASNTYKKRFGSRPRLFRAKTFNEKIYVRMALDRRPLLTQISGKWETRTFVRDRLGSEALLPPLVAALRHPDDCNGLKLPQRWIMKTSHASGYLRIVTKANPIDEAEMRRLVADWIRVDFDADLLEWAYRDLQRVVVIEELMEHNGAIPRDIKFFCFNGKAIFIQVDSTRFSGHRQSLFDLNWNLLNVQVMDYQPHLDSVAKPECLSEMIRIAERLSAGIDFVRVDLYDLGPRVMVGEMTVYPQNGGGIFNPPSWDFTFGSHWKLPPVSVMRGWTKSPQAN